MDSSTSRPPTSGKDAVPQVTFTSASPRSTDPPIKSPRIARFAEATTVNSPVEPTRNPFKDPEPPTNHYMPQPQVSDVGFGYVNQRASVVSVEVEETDDKYLAPMTPALKTPGLKSALKSPGAPPRNLETILSPTFKEEEELDRHEKRNDREQKRDLKSKIRVRWAKFFMRGVNFGCSLIVLSMLATTLTIFRATKELPKRNNLPSWAPGTKVWPQALLLSIACVSLGFCLLIFWQYCKGGHERAEKVAVYFTTFSVAFYLFSIIMWAIGAFAFQSAKNNGNGQDLWGWSCKDNTRKKLFEKDVDYALVCRLQNWSLICAIIEIVVEVITIIIYGITFYRFYSKRRLRKTMAARDRARSDLYLAQLKASTAPNTPGFVGGNGLLSPRDGGWCPPQGYASYNADIEKGLAADDISPVSDDGTAGDRFITINDRKINTPKPFALQAPPLAKPHRRKDSLPTPTSASTAATLPFSTTVVAPPPAFTAPHAAFAAPAIQPMAPLSPLPIAAEQTVNDHVPAAPGEVQYGAVAIPGAYAAPMSPGFVPNHFGSLY